MLAAIPSILYLMGIKWVSLPLALVSIIGIATSFILGFRNSATYDRTWEVRKIWGGIVNTSRTFAMLVNDNLQINSTLSQKEIEEEKEKLANGHFAWLTALRHQLRAPKAWEIMQNTKKNRAKKFTLLSYRVEYQHGRRRGENKN